ncbi:hypothetical protein ACFE04_029446 [Oxalis oulophora]
MLDNYTHIHTSNGQTTLKLDRLNQKTGIFRAGFASNDYYLFGKFDIDIKLVPGDSAGTVVELFLTSEQPNKDQIDLKFLGNVSGEPYILQTNIYADGFANREQRIYLWFMVDSIPIRVYKNHADKGISYPRWQPMSMKAKIYDGASWATRGKTIDWSKSPFIATFKDYKIDACIWNGNARFCRSDSEVNWWNKDRYDSLTSVQNRWNKWVKKNHKIYNYCQDNKRFHNDLPKECSLPTY